MESGGTFTLCGQKITNSGQITTGRAAIVVSYICREKGWNRNGDEYFSLKDYSVKSAAGKFTISGDYLKDMFPGRKIMLVDATGQSIKTEVATSRLATDGVEFTVKEPLAGLLPQSVKLSRIITDIEISDNEIMYSYVNGIYTNGVYRLRISNNKIYDCNIDNSQFTGTVVEVQNGRYVEFINNWIIDDRTEKMHKKPYCITAEKCRDFNTRID